MENLVPVKEKQQHFKTDFELACFNIRKSLQYLNKDDRKQVLSVLCDLAGVIPPTMPTQYTDKTNSTEQSYRIVFRDLLLGIIGNEGSKKLVEVLSNVAL